MTMRRTRLSDAGLIAAVALAASLLAPGSPAAPPAFEAQSGRRVENFPPDRAMDHRHMRLELTIADMQTPRIRARQTLTMAPIAHDADEVRLDAKLLEIESVASPGRAATFEHDGMVLLVRLDPAVRLGEEIDLTIDYSLADPPDGLFWTPQSEAWPDRAAQIHTQGQPETNSYWFPCHDFPHERLTSEMIVAAPVGFLVSSNGRLVERRGGRLSESGQRVEIWHFSQDQPHPAYLVSLVVGRFDVVDVRDAELPMPVYVPPGRAADVEGTYGRTAEMLRFYENILEEPYPWAKYAQLVVHNFGAGGMENTSATTLFDTAIIAPDELDDHDLAGLISHELAHQWFGDLITCASWEHLWLNEGFATYSEALWWEYDGGDDAYFADVLANAEAVIEEDTGAAPQQPAMVSRRYGHPDDVFGRASNPYAKGASVLHMLRQRVGDGAFFAILREHVDRNRQRSVETDEFRRIAEEISGESLELFFHQWTRRPGIPRVRAEIAWEQAAGELAITLRQTQRIDADNPAFQFDLPVHIELPPRRGERTPRVRRGVVEVRGREASARFPLEARPEMVALNPRLEVLAELEITQDARAWLHQLHHGPTLAARAQAARRLAALAEMDAGDALYDVAADAGAHWALRRVAVEALARRGDAERLLRLGAAGLDEPRVRMSVALGLSGAVEAGRWNGSRLDRRVLDMLEGMVRQDDSTRTQGEALRSLGRLGSREHLGLMLEMAERRTQHDQMRRAALEAVRQLDAPEGFALAQRLARPGHNQRTRAEAAETMAVLSHHNRDDAVRMLSELLDDRVAAVRSAALEGLVTIGDERGLIAIERAREATRDPVRSARLADAAERLGAAQ